MTLGLKMLLANSVPPPPPPFIFFLGFIFLKYFLLQGHMVILPPADEKQYMLAWGEALTQQRGPVCQLAHAKYFCESQLHLLLNYEGTCST